MRSYIVCVKTTIHVFVFFSILDSIALDEPTPMYAAMAIMQPIAIPSVLFQMRFHKSQLHAI